MCGKPQVWVMLSSPRASSEAHPQQGQRSWVPRGPSDLSPEVLETSVSAAFSPPPPWGQPSRVCVWVGAWGLPRGPPSCGLLSTRRLLRLSSLAGLCSAGLFSVPPFSRGVGLGLAWSFKSWLACEACTRIFVFPAPWPRAALSQPVPSARPGAVSLPSLLVRPWPRALGRTAAEPALPPGAFLGAGSGPQRLSLASSQTSPCLQPPGSWRAGLPAADAWTRKWGEAGVASPREAARKRQSRGLITQTDTGGEKTPGLARTRSAVSSRSPQGARVGPEPERGPSTWPALRRETQDLRCCCCSSLGPVPVSQPRAALPSSACPAPTLGRLCDTGWPWQRRRPRRWEGLGDLWSVT